jgi:hypothetical protein
MHSECLLAKYPNKMKGIHPPGASYLVLPIHHVDSAAPETRESILNLKGEQWYGPVIPPPDEILLVPTPEVAEQEYGNVWGNTKTYTIVFSDNAWAFKS